MQFGGIQARKKTEIFKRLPFNYCSLSLQPFEHPVCTPDGIIFDLRTIYPYIKKHGTNPVTGEKLEAKSLIKLNFSKNSNGEYHCPATFRVFNDHTHIVAIRTTGNVYTYEAIERLNIKSKNWKDLLTDEPFTRKDIITIQDPHNIESRNLSNFYHLKNDLTVDDEDKSSINDRLNDINLGATGSAARVLAKISGQKDEASDRTKDADDESKSNQASPSSPLKQKKKVIPYNAAPYTRGLAAASFTSTAMTPVTENENALIDEEEFMFKEVKSKGYARIIKNFMIQGGDPTGTGRGGESYWKKDFADEFKSNLSHSERGLLSMANRGKNTNSSQFFFTFRPCTHLDNKHTIFGKLVGGKEVLDKMESVPTDDSDRPLSEIRITDVTVFVDPYEEYKNRLEKKLSREAGIVKKRKISPKDEQDSTTNWFGTKLTSSGNLKEDSKVGKYLMSSNKREIDDASNKDLLIESTPKKPKPSGYDFDFKSNVLLKLLLTQLSGVITDACCDYETVEKVNEDIAQRVQELVKTNFFKYYKLNLYKECPFWMENGQCMNRACAVETVDESHIPESWRSNVLGALQTSSAGILFHPYKKCEYSDQDFCVVEDEADVEGVFVNLHDNPERFTGYAGASASRVWKAIYEENCFNFLHAIHDQTSRNNLAGLLQEVAEKSENGNDVCFEKRGPNLDCFISRFGSHPERIQNVYFDYVVLMRAISKMSEYLRGYEFCTGDKVQDAQVKKMVSKLVNTAESCPGTFDEKQMFSSPESRLLKEEFKNHFRNVSRIMDCVGCEKCRLWGKLQISGLGTALKVLFSYDDEYFNPKVHPNLLTRTEIVALFNTFNRFSESLKAIERFRLMYQQRINDLKVDELQIVETPPPIVITKPANITNKSVNHFPETGFFIDLMALIKEMISLRVVHVYSIILQKLEQWHVKQKS
ncbi:6447_t:CDS:10 [Acaulospora colombiana]|uniref:6447_t:CDS:1 n=1 Tax=Acaulospora colombiana TaxID=27376 RepID=A0ACA9KTN4_9GLOM|nr:6447_t:CDS:10 [Acaulospora colombiana]